MKKTLMFMMAFLVSMLCVVPVYAADAEYATVTENTSSDSLLDGNHPIVTGSGTAEVTVTVDGGKYKLLDGNSGSGVTNRVAGYTWVGLSFELPEGSKEVKIGDNTYSDSEGNGKFTFTEWFGFKDTELTTAAKDKKNLEKSWKLTWKDKDDSSHEQTIKLVVVPEKVVVEAQADSTVVWNEEKYLTESKQKKLTYHVVCDASAEVCTSYEDVMYYDEDATKEAIETQLRNLVGTKSKGLVVEGIYNDEKMSTAYDFSKNSSEDAYVKLVVKATENEKTPETGDNVITFVSLGVVAIISALGSAICLRKVNE